MKKVLIRMKSGTSYSTDDYTIRLTSRPFDKLPIYLNVLDLEYSFLFYNYDDTMIVYNISDKERIITFKAINVESITTFK